MTSPKMRMLNAYRGIYSDQYPVAPEFWVYYPAKVLGVDMIEFEREIPHWQAMQITFQKYNADGWCIAAALEQNPHVEVSSQMKKITGSGEEEKYRDSRILRCDGVPLEQTVIYTKTNPSWVQSHPVKTEQELDAYVRAVLSCDVCYDFSGAITAHEQIGEDLLIEYALGDSFFDFFAGAMGFEEAVYFFLSEHERQLEEYFELYLSSKIRHLRAVAENTAYESVFIGCNASCNSLLGPTLWRQWDKPYLKAITEEAHRLGLLIHSHNHGKIMDTVSDLAEIGFDCVCPFERAPGDVNGLEGLKKVRRLLRGRVTFNGNVSTVSTLIRGTPDDVRREVREIKTAFAGTPRLIIGTGDQVGGETPEENIYAMLEEGRRKD